MKILFMCLAALSMFAFADTNDEKWILGSIAFILVAIFIKLNESNDNNEPT